MSDRSFTNDLIFSDSGREHVLNCCYGISLKPRSPCPAQAVQTFGTKPEDYIQPKGWQWKLTGPLPATAFVKHQAQTGKLPEHVLPCEWIDEIDSPIEWQHQKFVLIEFYP